ncbi:MAG: anthranilate phosphoribosyltransferase [Proteobacteria bacterium]|nr:anthranilate phosphoribosyltransferase [Pseudomonadota bacterium]
MLRLQNAIELVSKGTDLTKDETTHLFNEIFDGDATESEIESFLVALRNKGESVAELSGAVASMRAHMKSIIVPSDSIDIVGTGGDGHGTLNVSTATALVVAGSGVPVAKHGNRAASSQSGSSDVLSELGVNLEPAWDRLESSIEKTGIVFFFAPRHHPSMKYVAPVRKKLQTRTIFNLLGPLTNPGNVTKHLIGVFDPAWSVPMAETLHTLGSDSAWVTHGANELDELSTTGDNHIVSLKDGSIDTLSLSPVSCDLPLATLKDIKGGNPTENAEAIRQLLNGVKGPYRDIVLLNAAAALIVAGKASALKDGIKMVAKSIDSGAAKEILARLVEHTNHG